MKNAFFVWAEGPLIKNSAYIFTLDLDFIEEGEFTAFVSAFNFYKLYHNGELLAFGPSRSAKGYFRRDKIKISLNKGKNRLSVICFAYNVANYSYVIDQPFFYFSASYNNREITAYDFLCHDFTDKLKNTQRYSFQRGFCEVYEQKADLKHVLMHIEEYYPEMNTVQVQEPKLLHEHFESQLRKVFISNSVQNGVVSVDESMPFFNDRSITQVGNFFNGYKRDELCELITDKVSRLVSKKQKKKEYLSKDEYALFDVGKNITGFIGFDIIVCEDCELYVIFDEIFGTAEVPVNFKRLSCANVMKWTLSKGKYSIQSADLYTLRYSQVIVAKGRVKIICASITVYEKSGGYNLIHSTDDREIDVIIDAAISTASQNTIDVLMDCPSRERSCWINDVYFSRHSACFFAGDDKSLKMSLENYILSGQLRELPVGMIPMCYPAEHLNGEYIPNCAMWYAIILCEYLKENKLSEYKPIIDKQLDGLLSFFAGYENEYGLLENLDSWIFIEWSVANTAEYVECVNYPSNMTYYKMLVSIAGYRCDDRLLKKAEVLKSNILKFSYNGTYFEDNSIRKNGKLTRTGHTSEACQYYAFELGVASKKEYPLLFEILKNNFSSNRDANKNYPMVGKANVIVGLLMRLSLLIENGETGRVVKEIKDVYLPMAIKTGTLWENTEPAASCNHGIAAYAGYILIKALTGFVRLDNEMPVFTDSFSCKNGEFIIPCGEKKIIITIKDGKRFIQTKKVKVQKYVQD